MKRTHSLPWLLAAVAILCFATGAAAQSQGVVKASATIAGCTDSSISGRAILVERPTSEGVKEVLITLFVQGLPAGKHAVHIHEIGSCGNTAVACGGAGGHFDPGPNSNSSPDGNHPFHSGDLINVSIGSSGSGVMHTVTSRITLSAGPLSLFDANGSAFIIHTGTDTYCPAGAVAGCAGGSRAACGVITLEP
jgi:Cu-Zn family superoxide dismutase